jgi:hypothetical protein
VSDDQLGWTPRSAALGQGDGVFLQYLNEPRLEAFTNWISHPSAVSETNREIFDYTLYDLSKLIDELRFEAGVGAVFKAALADELTTLGDEQHEGPVAMGIPIRARALLTAYHAPLPLPSELFKDAAQPMAGFRVLGGWWAGQLFDSAMLRGSAALDRLSTILHCADGRVVDPKWMPGFNVRHLSRLHKWDGLAEWDQLLGLINSPWYDLTHNYRRGFVHERRQPSALHGDHSEIITAPNGQQIAGETYSPDNHEALVLGFYNEVVLQAVDLTGALLSEKP